MVVGIRGESILFQKWLWKKLIRGLKVNIPFVKNIDKLLAKQIKWMVFLLQYYINKGV